MKLDRDVISEKLSAMEEDTELKARDLEEQLASERKERAMMMKEMGDLKAALEEVRISMQ